MKLTTKDIVKKMLHESLNSELIESLLDEDYPTTWDIDQFKALRKFSERVKYCEANLQRISSGSSRIVYKIDDTKVLKLAKNQKGIAQNETEIEWGQDGYYGQILARTIESDPNALWVEMELARKVTNKMLEQFFGVPLMDVQAYMHNILMNSRMRYSIEQQYKDILDEHPFVNMLLNFCHDLGTTGSSAAHINDLCRASSYGLVKRGGENEIVLIDFGLTESVYTTYYT